MSRSWPVRLQALLLALLILGGGGRLPVVDGAVFHHDGGAVPGGAVLLAADAAAPHGTAEHLVSGVPASGPAPAAEGRVHAAPVVGRAERITPSATPRTRRPDPPSLPRAPPIRA